MTPLVNCQPVTKVREPDPGTETIRFFSGASRIMSQDVCAVGAIRRAIEHDADWDVAATEDRLHFYILRAAQNVGRFEPFTECEKELNAYLAQRMAGKRLCDYAWRMLAASQAA